MERMYVPPKYDRSPHDLFVEMDELEGEEWVETARWIKYEEDREEGTEKWGKAHISSLSFHSLIGLRLSLEEGVLLLDLEARDLPSVVYRCVEELFIEGIIEEEQKGEVLRVLLFRHKYVSERQFKGPRSQSRKSISSLVIDSERDFKNLVKTHEKALSATDNGVGSFSKLGDHVIEMSDTEGAGSGTELPRNSSNPELFRASHFKKESIMRRLKTDTEGTLVLVGSMDDIKKPIVAFVRMAEGIIMPHAMEVPLPVRFVFILLTPKYSPSLDYHEVGRAFSTLMSNPRFHNVCYRIDERRELLSAINEFLDESVVLPPGDWEGDNLLSMQDIQEMRQRQRKKKEGREQEDNEIRKEVEGVIEEKEEKEDDDEKKHPDPMVRTNIPFGGLINDIKRRYPWYVSDFLDGLNSQCIAATIFIYFACLSGAIAFGGILGEKTEGYIGVPETILLSSVGGLIFALFAGQPLIITGVTGPVLLYDEALWGFSTSLDGLEYLPFRVWIGIWLLIIALLVAAFQGSTLVKYFTKFTKDIFASLVALLFIFEAMRKLFTIFKEHPLISLDTYCTHVLDETLANIGVDGGQPSPLGSGINSGVEGNSSESLLLRSARSLPDNGTYAILNNGTSSNLELLTKREPNTALLSAILMFGTFFIAYFLRIFRNGKYLGRTVRRALGDFGVPIAIVLMVFLDFSLDDTFTQKLNVPSGLSVTDSTKRGWLISPLGLDHVIPIWLPFVSCVPAILLYLLLFMETHICELIMLEKTSRKGGGVHLDIVILSIINFISAFFGGPWICAATVRACSHVAALTVMSTTHAPGESAKIVEVKDQRFSAFCVSLLLGVSILMSPILKYVPFAVLFGVFLYMGVSAINGIQLFDRIALLFMPVKHHPQVSYVRRVKTWKMNMFTVVQIMGLALLWIVKSTKLALAFPFFVVAMIPYRMSLKFFYTERELDALDGPKAGQVLEDDPDFYDQAYGG